MIEHENAHFLVEFRKKLDHATEYFDMVSDCTDADDPLIYLAGPPILSLQREHVLRGLTTAIIGLRKDLGLDPLTNS